MIALIGLGVKPLDIVAFHGRAHYCTLAGGALTLAKVAGRDAHRRKPAVGVEMATALGARQQVADCHAGSTGPVENKNVPGFHFRLHGVAAGWHPVSRAGVAAERAVKLA
jgi:hypothetical protein